MSPSTLRPRTCPPDFSHYRLCFLFCSRVSCKWSSILGPLLCVASFILIVFLRSIYVLKLSVISSSSLLSGALMCKCTTIHKFIVLTMGVCVQVIRLLSCPSRGITRTKGKDVFNFMRKWQTILKGVCTILHPRSFHTLANTGCHQSF